jgi:hypothetical protein
MNNISALGVKLVFLWREKWTDPPWVWSRLMATVHLYTGYWKLEVILFANHMEPQPISARLSPTPFGPRGPVWPRVARRGPSRPSVPAVASRGRWPRQHASACPDDPPVRLAALAALALFLPIFDPEVPSFDRVVPPRRNSCSRLYCFAIAICCS